METNNKLKFLLDLQTFAEKETGEELPSSDELDPNDFEDEDANNAGEENTKSEKVTQSRERNAEEARKRREKEQKEREEKIRQEAYEKGRRDALLNAKKLNSYTGSAIENEEELEIFNLQEELAKEGKDPLKDLPKALANKRIEKRKLEEKAQKDVEEFMSHFSSKEDGQKALDSAKFKAFAKGKVGQGSTLYEIYQDFSRIFEEQVNTSGSTPPAPKGDNKQSKNKDVSKMNRVEFDEYFRSKYGG